jgi:hypothetical protein
MAKKTDNANLGAKLELRRYFLRTYHVDEPIRVFECCQGSGVIWRELQKEFELASYWGVDVKPRKGRLKVDSSRVICQPGWTENVIDIDTYGQPWKHWEGMLPHVVRPISVFLTIGQVKAGMGSPVSNACREALGLGSLTIPPGIGCKLNEIAVSQLLTRCYAYALILTEAVEAVSHGNARYIGVRLEPIKTPAEQVTTAKRAKHPRSTKETEHA